MSARNRRTAGRTSLPAVSLLVPAVLLAVTGCVGQLSLDAEEEVSPGAALGFTSINYVSRLSVGGVFTQNILDIDADGRATLVTARGDNEAVREPFRFLPQDKLLEVRRNFADSDFFFWADSTYGDGPAPRTQSIVFEVGEDIDELIRYDEAPVPPSILVLMDQLEELILEGFFGEGSQVPVEQIFSGQSTRIERREFVVVRSEETLLDLLFRIGSIELSVLPRVDYSREMLACVFLGSGSGRTLSVEAVEAYVSGNRAQLLYRRRDAGVGCDLTARPFLIAKLPRLDVPLELFEAVERDTSRCEIEP